jgi:transcriptional regulator with XRE-family HTH domain
MAKQQTIGANIKRYREERGMSAKELSEKSGVSKSYLSELENPKDGTKNPSAEVLYDLAQALGVAMSDLMGRPIIIAPAKTPPASLKRFLKGHPKMPQADIEMLTQIQFRGEPPQSAERWEFIYQAIKNSEAMDRK